MTESPITPGPFIGPDQHDAIRAQIDTLKAITAYYASITVAHNLGGGRRTYTVPVDQVRSAQSARDALRKINESEPTAPSGRLVNGKTPARGGFIYPTTVEIVDTSRGPEAGITFAWSPDQPHRLSRNEAMKLRDQLSQFLLDSAKQLSPEVKP